MMFLGMVLYLIQNSNDLFLGSYQMFIFVLKIIFKIYFMLDLVNTKILIKSLLVYYKLKSKNVLMNININN